MGKKVVMVMLGILLGSIQIGWASEYKTAESGICTQVVDHKGVGFQEGFDRTVGTLSCFTTITGPSPGAAVRKIVHVWYYKGVACARIALPVKGVTWRTYSKKSILPSETGDWRVDVLDPEGTVIGVFQFFIKE